MTGLPVTVVLASTAGGTGRHAAMLAAGAAARGMRVTVAGPAAAASQLGAGAQLSYLPLEIAARPQPARDTVSVLRLRRHLAATGPGVVHAHGLRAAAVAALALAGTPRRRRVPLLVTVHNAAPDGAAAAAVYRALERLAAWRADAVLCVSADLAARMRRAGAREVGLAVVAAPPAAVPPVPEVAAARAGLHAGRRPVVLGAGRLARQKGFDVAIDAMARLGGTGPAPLLVIAGEGPLRGQLAARARAARVALRLAGQRADIPALLAAADVVIVPSRWEGQSLLVAEALQAGRPLIASRAGGTAAMTGADAAVLVPPQDPAALAAAVAAVLADPALARRLGAAAAARAGRLPRPEDAVSAAVLSYTRLAGSAGSRQSG